MDFDNPRLDKTAFSVVGLYDEPDDKEFWLSKTPLERWQMMEFLRQMNYGYDPDTTRLQRVFTVAQRERR